MIHHNNTVQCKKTLHGDRKHVFLWVTCAMMLLFLSYCSHGLIQYRHSAVHTIISGDVFTSSCPHSCPQCEALCKQTQPYNTKSRHTQGTKQRH